MPSFLFLRKILPNLLLLFTFSFPLFTDNLGDVGIVEIRIASGNGLLVMLSIKDECISWPWYFWLRLAKTHVTRKVWRPYCSCRSSAWRRHIVDRTVAVFSLMNLNKRSDSFSRSPRRRRSRGYWLLFFVASLSSRVRSRSRPRLMNSTALTQTSQRLCIVH